MISRGRPPGRLLALFAAAFVATGAFSQEIVFGGEAGFAAGVRGSAEAPQAMSPFFRLGIEPDLSIFANTAELRVSGALERSFESGDEGQLTAELDTLHLRLYPSDRVTVDLGLRRQVSGGALLLSPVDYLAPVVFEAAGDLPNTAGSSPLLGATVFIGGGYLSAHVSPSPAELLLPEFDTSALDAVPILATLDDPDAGGALTRASFALGDTVGIDAPWRRTSFGLEAGGALGPVDVTAIYYHGVDRIPTVTATIDTTTAQAGEFDLIASPAESVIDAFGLSAQAAAGPAIFWLDGSWVLGRTFGTLDAVPTSAPGVYALDTVVAPHVELVAGGLVQVSRPDLLIAAEYRHGFIGTDRTDVVRLDFPGTALFSVTAGLLDGLVSATAASVVLLADASAAVLGRVAVEPSQELSVFLQAPFVLAGEESLLGGLRSTRAVTAGLTYRF